MREIKFRAWDSVNKILFLPDSKSSRRGYLADFLRSHEDCEELMQFTGLHDKNGKEIYEGDVIKDPDENEILGEVCRADDGQYICGGYTGNDFDELEIIGNTYENPELVGGGK